MNASDSLASLVARWTIIAARRDREARKLADGVVSSLGGNPLAALVTS